MYSVKRAAAVRYLFFFLMIVSAVPIFGDSKKIIIVGDSRAQEMHEFTGDAGCLWSYKVGSGYEWMVSEGVPVIDAQVTEGSAVVIMLGVNDVVDPFRISQYVDYINKKAAEWKDRGAETFYVSINPVDDARSTLEHNSDIEFWNDMIQQLFSPEVIYLDTYHPLLSGFWTVDGLHYTGETYLKIFDLVVSGVDLYQGAVISFEPVEIPPDTAVTPQMTFTAADTENEDNPELGNERWALVAGHLRYIGKDGKLVSGLQVIGEYVCYFDEYGDLMWQVRK